MVNNLILGTVQFGMEYGINNTVGRLGKEQIFELLDFAFIQGIKTLDTAEVYGSSHKIIANYHKQSNNRFNIITKYSSFCNEYPSDIISRIKKHCLDFDINCLDGYMFHSFKEFLSVIDNDPKVLKRIKETGLVEKIGVSVYSNSQIEEVFKYKDISLIQLPYNLLDNDAQRGEVLKKSKKLNIEIHTRSVFLQGLFFKDLNKLPEYLSPLNRDLKNINSLATKSNFTISELALNYPLSKSYLDKVLIGVDSLMQLKSNISSINKDFDVSIYDKIDKIKVKNTELLNPANWKI